MDLINVIKETRATKAQGSAEGRAKMRKNGAKTKASKSRVKVYDSITTALQTVFTSLLNASGVRMMSKRLVVV
jgi:hypothetical protein